MKNSKIVQPKKKRKRVISINKTKERVPVIVSLSKQFKISYQKAFDAYISAQKYCKTFNDKTILEQVEFIIEGPKTVNVNKFRKFS